MSLGRRSYHNIQNTNQIYADFNTAPDAPDYCVRSFHQYLQTDLIWNGTLLTLETSGLRENYLRTQYWCRPSETWRPAFQATISIWIQNILTFGSVCSWQIYQNLLNLDTEPSNILRIRTTTLDERPKLTKISWCFFTWLCLLCGHPAGIRICPVSR